jgi:hypothetical protein
MPITADFLRSVQEEPSAETISVRLGGQSRYTAASEKIYAISACMHRFFTISHRFGAPPVLEQSVITDWREKCVQLHAHSPIFIFHFSFPRNLTFKFKFILGEYFLVLSLEYDF